MNNWFDPYDQQEDLIKKEIHQIRKQSSRTSPYFTSSFNKQFDNYLKQLVVEYEFDLDKIALHLYYLFPVYEQKITSRTVGVRWWQLMMEERVCGEMKEDRKNDDYMREELKQADGQQLSQQIVRRQYFCVKLSQEKSSITSYRQALSQSLVLQQEQCDRLIMYKPKFIIDSQYKLQRYEMLNQVRNNSIDSDRNGWNMNNIRNDDNVDDNKKQEGIQQILSKVVNNQFVYDQFGTFITILNQSNRSNKMKIQQQSNYSWWQDQLSSDQSQSSEGQYDDKKNKQEEQDQNDVIDQKMFHNNHQEYVIDDNWDQYDSD